jgi:predicted KAP-like P-loop ATPase
MQDVDRASLVGSLSSDQFTSSTEKRLKVAQDTIQRLEVLTREQQVTIQRLVGMINDLRERLADLQ